MTRSFTILFYRPPGLHCISAYQNKLLLFSPIKLQLIQTAASRTLRKTKKVELIIHRTATQCVLE